MPKKRNTSSSLPKRKTNRLTKKIKDVIKERERQKKNQKSARDRRKKYLNDLEARKTFLINENKKLLDEINEINNTIVSVSSSPSISISSQKFSPLGIDEKYITVDPYNTFDDSWLEYYS